MSSYSPTSNSKQLEAIYKKKVSKFESAIKANEQKLIKLNERKSNALDYFLDKTISKNEYDSYIAKYTKEAEILSNELTAFKSSLEILTAPSTLEKISSLRNQRLKLMNLLQKY